MAILLNTDGTTRKVVPADGKSFELKEMQSLVGGYIEFIRLSASKLICLNEEGKLLGLEINELATGFAHISGAIDLNDYIVGPAIQMTTTEAGEDEEEEID